MPAMDTCNKCSEVLVSPLACGSCDSLFPAPGALSPFDVLGLPLAAHVDRSALRKRLLELQRLMHPDFHGAAGETLRDLAEHNTAELNAAFELLRDEAKRSSWLVEHLGGPTESDERQMPKAFLMEVMEWNEELETLRAAEDPAASLPRLADFRAQLNLQRAGLLEGVLDKLHDELGRELRVRETLVALRRDLNAIRYIDRALTEVAALTLAAEEAGQV